MISIYLGICHSKCEYYHGFEINVSSPLPSFTSFCVSTLFLWKKICGPVLQVYDSLNGFEYVWTWFGVAQAKCLWACFPDLEPTETDRWVLIFGRGINCLSTESVSLLLNYLQRHLCGQFEINNVILLTGVKTKRPVMMSGLETNSWPMAYLIFLKYILRVPRTWKMRRRPVCSACGEASWHYGLTGSDDGL